MGVHDGAELRGRLEAGHQIRRHHRRHRQHHAIVGNRELVLAEVEGGDPILREIERARYARFDASPCVLGEP